MRTSNKSSKSSKKSPRSKAVAAKVEARKAPKAGAKAAKSTKTPKPAVASPASAPVAPPTKPTAAALTTSSPSAVAQTRVLDEASPKKAIAALQKFGSTELQRIFSALFGAVTTSRNVMFLRSAISKGLLDRADGNRPVPPAEETRAARQAPSLAPAAPKAPRRRDHRLPPVGTTLERLYKGDTIRVKVLEEGFSYKGTTYSSLSALAKTFTHCSTNGLLWFGLTQRPDKGSTADTSTTAKA